MTTFISAVFADPAHQVAMVQTEEIGSVILSQQDTPDEWERLLAEIEPTSYVVPDLDLRLMPLTARQLRLGLVSNGIALEQVEAAIAAIEDPQERAVASIEWEYAAQFERDHPLIAQVGAALGLTDEAVDEMWAAAASL